MYTYIYITKYDFQLVILIYQIHITKKISNHQGAILVDTNLNPIQFFDLCLQSLKVIPHEYLAFAHFPAQS
jgi:hypothetical protein